MARLPSFLETNHAHRANKPEGGSELELPLADNPSLFGKKDESEQSGEDDRGAPEDGVHPWTHVIERHGLRDLMNDVRQ